MVIHCVSSVENLTDLQKGKCSAKTAETYESLSRYLLVETAGSLTRVDGFCSLVGAGVGSWSSLETSEGFLDLEVEVSRPMFQSSKSTSVMCSKAFPAVLNPLVFLDELDAASRGLSSVFEAANEAERVWGSLKVLRDWDWDPSRDEGSLLLGKTGAVGFERDVLRNNQIRWSARLFRVMKPA